MIRHTVSGYFTLLRDLNLDGFFPIIIINKRLVSGETINCITLEKRSNDLFQAKVAVRTAVAVLPRQRPRPSSQQ